MEATECLIVEYMNPRIVSQCLAQSSWLMGSELQLVDLYALLEYLHSIHRPWYCPASYQEEVKEAPLRAKLLGLLLIDLCLNGLQFS